MVRLFTQEGYDGGSRGALPRGADTVADGPRQARPLPDTDLAGGAGVPLAGSAPARRPERKSPGNTPNRFARRTIAWYNTYVVDMVWSTWLPRIDHVFDPPLPLVDSA